MSDYGSVPPPPPPSGGGAAGPVDHPKGTMILVLGILSLICCSPLGIAAWLMGNTALKEIDAQPGRYGNRQLVQIGRILGIVAVVLMIISAIVGVLWLVGAVTFAGLESTTTTP